MKANKLELNEKIEATNEATNQLSKEVECELQKILTGKHELMK